MLRVLDDVEGPILPLSSATSFPTAPSSLPPLSAPFLGVDDVALIAVKALPYDAEKSDDVDAVAAVHEGPLRLPLTRSSPLHARLPPPSASSPLASLLVARGNGSNGRSLSVLSSSSRTGASINIADGGSSVVILSAVSTHGPQVPACSLPPCPRLLPHSVLSPYLSGDVCCASAASGRACSARHPS